jgi:hypothetical protein
VVRQWLASGWAIASQQSTAEIAEVAEIVGTQGYL